MLAPTKWRLDDPDAEPGAARPTEKLRLLGKSVCPRAWRSLVGIGSARYTRLRKAALTGQPAPLDARTFAKGFLFKSRKSLKRQRIVEFLEHLYQTVSEPLPEYSAQKRRKAQQSQHELEGGDAPIPKPMRFRKRRGRKPKLKTRSLLQGTSAGAAVDSLRLLPPGSFSDYFAMFQAKNRDEKVSLKLFNSATRPILLFFILFRDQQVH